MKKIIIIYIILFLIICFWILLQERNKQPKIGAIDDILITKLQEKYDLATEIKSKYQIDEVSLIKTDIKNAELDKYKNEPKDEVKITIGDNTPVIKVGLFGAETETKEFKPNIELKRWNEVFFKLKTDNLLKDVATKDKTLTFEGDKIKFGTPKISFEMYDYAEGEGGYKYIWYLNEKPATNKVEFQIESSGLDFFYQPPLTQEYQNGYSEEFKKDITVTETQVKDLDGNVLVERPENIVGSYAVYHSTKGGMNDINGKEYKTGKAFHIYRPHIIDAEGKETWGILKIANGIYSVEIPQNFLDTAVYPIKSNDTFGYTGIGGTEGANSALYMLGSLFAAPANVGPVSKITTYFNAAFAANRYYKGVIVLHSNLNIINNGVGNASVGISTTINNWYDSTFATPPSLTASTDYVLMMVSSATLKPVYDNGDANQGHIDLSNDYTTPTNPTDADPYPASGLAKVSIYATYTPAGGGAAYCGHTGGDWYINGTCFINTSTTTSGTLYLTETGSLNCIDGATISVGKIKAKSGTKIQGKSNCKIKLWSSTP